MRGHRTAYHLPCLHCLSLLIKGERASAPGGSPAACASALLAPWLADPSALLERFGGGRAAAAALLARGGGAGGGLGSPLARGAAEAGAALRELAGALHERSLEV